MNELIVEGVEELQGTVRAPPSKSYTHRSVIAASLAEGTSRIRGPLWCDDTLATVHGCSAFGTEIEMRKKDWMVTGTPTLRMPKDVIDCRSSASTMRFLMPVSSLAPGVSVFVGSRSLSRRPMQPLISALRQLGAECRSLRGDGYPPIIVLGGGLKGGNAKMVGHVSSQFVSGLLFACPLAQESTKLTITTELESKPYVHMTLQTANQFGIHLEVDDGLKSYSIPPNQEYHPTDFSVEGDFSAAAFLMAAAVVTNSSIKITNLARNSLQGDKAIIDILESMGVQLEVSEDFVKIERGAELRGTRINVKDTPDLAPICAILAPFAEGRTEIVGGKRLRIKESDRLEALYKGLVRMGAKIKASEDGFVIEGATRLRGTSLDPKNDHRIAMAYAIAALGADGETRISDPDCINKSYPEFLRDLKEIGAIIHVG
ncbi:MAG: 3-phosphoshikimate 1-carboxyvinyltransferase [Candidatus Bathyarchaeia archaeon]